MICKAVVLVIAASLSFAVGQVKYGPYKGPPVVPVILPGGFLADTREVAQAKEYHLNALAKAAKEVKDTSGNKGYYNVLPRVYMESQVPQQLLYRPQTQPQQFVQSSPTPAPVYEGQEYDEADYQEAPVPRRYEYVSSTPRPDPQVTPVILDNGYIADTAEVDAAKAEHFAAVAKAQEAVARALARAADQRQPAGYQAVTAAEGYTGVQDSDGYRAVQAPGPQRFSDY